MFISKCLSVKSDFFVTLVTKTVIYRSKLLDFRAFASLELELAEPNTQVYGQTVVLMNQKNSSFKKYQVIIPEAISFNSVPARKPINEPNPDFNAVSES